MRELPRWSYLIVLKDRLLLPVVIPYLFQVLSDSQNDQAPSNNNLPIAFEPDKETSDGNDNPSDVEIPDGN